LCFRQIKWFKLRFIPYANVQMSGTYGANVASIKYTSSVYGPYLVAPSLPVLNNPAMQRTDGYKQVYGSKEHHRFVKNPAKTAFKLLFATDTRHLPY